MGGTQAVGSQPSKAWPYGAQDVAGNVWECVSYWYGSDHDVTVQRRIRSGQDCLDGPAGVELRKLKDVTVAEDLARSGWGNWRVPAKMVL